MLKIKHSGKEDLVLYSCGNRLIMYDLDTNRILLDEKIINDAIMVLYQC